MTFNHRTLIKNRLRFDEQAALVFANQFFHHIFVLVSKDGKTSSIKYSGVSADLNNLTGYLRRQTLFTLSYYTYTFTFSCHLRVTEITLLCGRTEGGLFALMGEKLPELILECHSDQLLSRAVRTLQETVLIMGTSCLTERYIVKVKHLPCHWIAAKTEKIAVLMKKLYKQDKTKGLSQYLINAGIQEQLFFVVNFEYNINGLKQQEVPTEDNVKPNKDNVKPRSVLFPEQQKESADDTVNMNYLKSDNKMGEKYKLSRNAIDFMKASLSRSTETEQTDNIVPQTDLEDIGPTQNLAHQLQKIRIDPACQNPSEIQTQEKQFAVASPKHLLDDHMKDNFWMIAGIRSAASVQPPGRPHADADISAGRLRTYMQQIRFRRASMWHQRGNLPFDVMKLADAGLYYDEDGNRMCCCRCSWTMSKTRFCEIKDFADVHQCPHIDSSPAVSEEQARTGQDNDTERSEGLGEEQSRTEGASGSRVDPIAQIPPAERDNRFLEIQGSTRGHHQPSPKSNLPHLPASDVTRSTGDTQDTERTQDEVQRTDLHQHFPEETSQEDQDDQIQGIGYHTDVSDSTIVSLGIGVKCRLTLDDFPTSSSQHYPQGQEYPSQYDLVTDGISDESADADFAKIETESVELGSASATETVTCQATESETESEGSGIGQETTESILSQSSPESQIRMPETHPIRQAASSDPVFQFSDENAITNEVENVIHIHSETVPNSEMFERALDDEVVPDTESETS